MEPSLQRTWINSTNEIQLQRKQECEVKDDTFLVNLHGSWCIASTPVPYLQISSRLATPTPSEVIRSVSAAKYFLIYPDLLSRIKRGWTIFWLSLVMGEDRRQERSLIWDLWPLCSWQFSLTMVLKTPIHFRDSPVLFFSFTPFFSLLFFHHT